MEFGCSSPGLHGLGVFAIFFALGRLTLGRVDDEALKMQ